MMSSSLVIARICSLTYSFYILSKRLKEKNIQRKEPIEQTLKLLIQLFQEIFNQSNEIEEEIYYLYFYYSFYICYCTNKRITEEFLSKNDKLIIFLNSYKANKINIHYKDITLNTIEEVYEQCKKISIVFTNNILVLPSLEKYFNIFKEL